MTATTDRAVRASAVDAPHATCTPSPSVQLELAPTVTARQAPPNATASPLRPQLDASFRKVMFGSPPASVMPLEAMAMSVAAVIVAFPASAQGARRALR